jgi:hypothetical protein
MLTINKAIVETDVTKNVWLSALPATIAAETRRNFYLFEIRIY